ncbi:MAG: prokaryotic E2 ligase family D protein [Peptococcaceae bacterium]|nr:prokaryotic E2 ligase family D protein [Peptococcaceae bacterium]
MVERNSQHPEQIVIIEREACIRSYNHMGEIYQVGYPKLILCYKVKNNRISGFYVAAVKDEIVNGKSEVYFFPYANVYHGGNVCMGSFIHPPLKELSELTYYPEAFYTIEHTHLTNAKNQLVLDILKEVENKPFDSGLLLFDCTFEQFVSRVTGVRK